MTPTIEQLESLRRSLAGAGPQDGRLLALKCLDLCADRVGEILAAGMPVEGERARELAELKAWMEAHGSEFPGVDVTHSQD